MLYIRFPLSLRYVEDLLHERWIGIFTARLNGLSLRVVNASIIAIKETLREQMSEYGLSDGRPDLDNHKKFNGINGTDFWDRTRDLLIHNQAL